MNQSINIALWLSLSSTFNIFAMEKPRPDSPLRLPPISIVQSREESESTNPHSQTHEQKTITDKNTPKRVTTALHFAARHQEPSEVKRLLETGIPANLKLYGSGNTPLHELATSLSSQISELQIRIHATNADCILKKYGPSLLLISNKEGLMPAQLAARNGYLHVLGIFSFYLLAPNAHKIMNTLPTKSIFTLALAHCEFVRLQKDLNTIPSIQTCRSNHHAPILSNDEEENLNTWAHIIKDTPNAHYSNSNYECSKLIQLSLEFLTDPQIHQLFYSHHMIDVLTYNQERKRNNALIS